MKVRLTVPVETRPHHARANRAPSALLRVGQAGAAAAVLAVTVAACTGGGSPTTSVFTPSPQVTTSTRTGPASDGASKTPSPSTSSRASATDKPSATAKASTAATATSAPTHHPSAAPSAARTVTARPTVTVTRTQYYPVGAPQTGGGGTAGLQDVTLFGAGAAAILAGFGTLAYRRRLTRKRPAEAPTHPSNPTHTPVP